MTDRPIVILGAGINGAAIARELALNGASVVVIDQADLASGATAYSSRLIHGGLRYLEYGEFSLVRESLAERTRLLRLAPHLVQPVRLYVPLARRTGGLWSSAGRFLGLGPGASGGERGLYAVRAGLTLYDRFAKDPMLPRHRVHSIAKREHLPPVDNVRYHWLVEFHDAQVRFPERFTVALLQDAAELARAAGARFEVFTYHRARLEQGTIAASPVDDAGSPGLAPFQPAAIVNATGAWADRTLQSIGASSPRLMGPTKGSHLITWHPPLCQALAEGGVYAEARDGRPVFLLPLGEAALVGTTDLPYDSDPADAVASEQEIDYLLDAIGRVFPQAQPKREDVAFHYSGVRPLPFVDRGAPSSVTRRHFLKEQSIGALPLFSIIGGKLTTCRSLAEEAAAAILERLGREASRNSRERPLPGAAIGFSHEELAGRLGFTTEQVAAVWHLCGAEAAHALAPPPDGAAELGDHASLDGTSLPVRYAQHVIRQEHVRRLADLVERRLMLLYHRRLTDACLRQLAELLAEAGRLDRDSIDAEVAACRSRLEQRYGKQVESSAAR